MIRFDQVCKSYSGGHEALRRVTFSVDKGELAVVTGHTGAGKSTLLNLVAAIEKPTSGDVVVNGQNISQLRRSALPYLRRNIGLIFQDHKLLYDRSVYENVALPLYINGFSTSEIGKRVRAALDKVDLLDREKSRPITLSGGEQQRVCIARAIVNRPSILLADEPTGNLDSEYANGIIDMFIAFHQVGVTLLIATHDARLIERTRARVLTLNHGELVA